MKSLSYALVAALLLATSGSAVAATESSTAESRCSFLKDPLYCALWAIKCIGYALGGNGCVGRSAATEAAAGPDVKEVVDCTKQAVKNFLQGTPQPCAVGKHAAGPDVKALVECTKSQVQQLAQGVEPMPCAV